MIDRRTVLAAGITTLAASIGGTAGAALAHRSAATPFFARHALPLGVQLYAIAPDLDADFDGTLAKLASIGIRSVEMAGFHGRTAAQLRGSFDRAGLTCRSAHIQAHANGNGPSFDGDLDVLAREMHTIGITDVLLPIPWQTVAPKSREDFVHAGSSMPEADWKRTAAFLNTTGAALHQRDLKIGYHNHNFEFKPIVGGTPMDLLLRETDPAIVSFEMDAGWVAAAGIDPVALLKRYPDRFTQMHVKDIEASTKTNFVAMQDPIEVGSGTMNWTALLPAAYAAGVSRFYIEQEPPYSGPRMASIAKSAAYLLGLKAA